MAVSSRAGRRSGRIRGGRGGRPYAARPLFAELFDRPAAHPIIRVVGALIRARAELCVVAVWVTIHVIVLKVGRLPSGWALVFETTVITVVGIIPVSRQYVTRRCWAVCSRHRVRAGLLQTRTMTYDGRIPWLLWSRPSPIGERIRVWLPAGLCVNDLQRQAEELATACWAREVRIHRVRAQAAMAVIEVVRRDPLAGEIIVAPEVTTIPISEPTIIDAQHSDGTVEALPTRDVLPRVTPLAEHPTVIGAHQQAGKDTGTSTDSDQETIEYEENTEQPVIRGLGGQDVSDYV